MSKRQCIISPNKLFDEFLEMTNNNRTLSKQLWGIASNGAIQRKLGLKNGFTAQDFIDSLSDYKNIEDILDRQSFLNYVSKTEEVNEAVFDSMRDAVGEVDRIINDYQSVSPIVYSSEGKFKIRILDKSQDNEVVVFTQRQLVNLNSQLIDYIGKLGFAVDEIEGLGTEGVFSPLDARENAYGLKTAIQVSKSTSGQKAIPEEISHLLVEGFQSNMFMQRLMNQMTDDVVEDILGDSYEWYYDKYKGDETLLKKESVGRLVAQHLVDRNGIGDQIRFISDKILNKMRDNLKKGSESDIDEFLTQLDENVKGFVNNTFGNNEIELFDKQKVQEFQDKLYKMEPKKDALRQAVEESYNILAKRVKLKSLGQGKEQVSSMDIRDFEKMDRLVEEQQNTEAAIHFLEYSINDCKQVFGQIQELQQDYEDGRITILPQLKRMTRIIISADTVVKAYKQNAERLRSLQLSKNLSEDVDESYFEEIKELATELTDVLNGIEFIYKELLVDSMAKVYQNYWSGDKEYTLNGKKQFVSLEDVLRENVGDMSGFSRFVNSLEDAQDPLLQMADMLLKDSINRRDQIIFALQQKLGAYMKEYVRDTGSRDMQFSFEMDENGKPTGYLKSDRNYAEFNRRKSELIQQLKDSGLKGPELGAAIKSWEADNTELVNVAPEGADRRRMERMPKKELYPANPHEGMNAAQIKLYDRLIETKKELDYLLPKSRTHLYLAPQKKIDVKDQLIQGKNIKGAVKRIKDKYVTDVASDTEYGEDVNIDQYVGGKHIVLDFSGKEVKKVPVFYTTKLDNMSVLDMNLIDSMLQYGAMAINYNKMSEVSDFMEATNLLMQDRSIIKTNGVRKLQERFKPTKDKAIQRDYAIKGRESVSAQRFRNYIDQNVYGIKKNKERIYIGGKEVNISKIGDAAKSYSSLVGLGYNLFSGTTNITMGIAQTLFEAASNSFAETGLYKVKDILKANKTYFKELPMCIMEQYNDIKSNKMSLLIQRMDCMEEYFQQIGESDYYGGVFKKIVGKNNPLIFNSMGEHYLHTVSMLAALNAVKVRVGKMDSTGTIQYGETMSLYDAIYVDEVEIEGVDEKVKYSTIKLPDNLVRVEQDSDGNETQTAFGEPEFNKLKLKIQQVNHRLHGAFNDIDRGDLHRFVVGRMIMQFRQWMPAFYMNRFRAQRINVLTGDTEEGFYNTYYKFIFGTLNDLAHLKVRIGERYGLLSDSQKSNLYKGLLESSTALSLTLMLKGSLGDPDKDDPGLVNLVKYNMYRLNLELVSASPFSYGFIDNIETLIKSPIPAMESVDRLMQIFHLSTMWDTIESGKYAGWNRYLRNLYFATPGAKNIGRFIDMVTEGDVSMFNPYIKAKSQS